MAPWVCGHSVLDVKVTIPTVEANLIFMSHFPLLFHLSKVATNWTLILLKSPETCLGFVCAGNADRAAQRRPVPGSDADGMNVTTAVTIFKL